MVRIVVLLVGLEGGLGLGLGLFWVWERGDEMEMGRGGVEGI